MRFSKQILTLGSFVLVLGFSGTLNHAAAETKETTPPVQSGECPHCHGKAKKEKFTHAKGDKDCEKCAKCHEKGEKAGDAAPAKAS